MKMLKKKVFLFSIILLLFVSSTYAMDVSVVTGEKVGVDVKHDFKTATLKVSPESAGGNKDFEQILSITNVYGSDLYYFVSPYFDSKDAKSVKIYSITYTPVEVDDFGDVCTQQANISSGKNDTVCSYEKIGKKTVQQPNYNLLNNVYTTWGDNKNYYTQNGILIKKGETKDFLIKYQTYTITGKWNARVWSNIINDYSCILDVKSNCVEDMTIDPTFTDGLVGYWSMDEASGTNVNNSVLGAVNGTATTPEPSVITGKNGNARYNGGVNGKNISLNTSVCNFGTGNFSVNLWFIYNSSLQSDFSMFMGNEKQISANYEGWYVGITGTGAGAESGKISFYTQNNAGASTFIRSATQNEFQNINTWTMATFVRTDGNLTIYVNGTYKNSVSGTVRNIDYGGTTCKLMSAGDSNAFAQFGGLDEVALYSRALSSSEVSQLFNSGSGLFYPFIQTDYSVNVSNVSFVSPVYETSNQWYGVNFSYGANVTNVTDVVLNIFNNTYSTYSFSTNGSWNFYNFTNVRVPLTTNNNTNYLLNFSYIARLSNGTNNTNVSSNYNQTVLWAYFPTNIYLNNQITEGQPNNWNVTYANLGNNTGVTFIYITQYNTTNITGTHLANSSTQINASFNNTAPSVYSLATITLTPFINVSFNGTILARNTSVTGTQQVLKFQNLTATYSNYLTYGGANYSRTLNIELNYSCNTSANGTIYILINGAVEDDIEVSCNSMVQSYNDTYTSSTEGTYNINYIFETITYYNYSTNNATFISDLYNPTISELRVVPKTGYFNETNLFNISLTCYDNMFTNITYNLSANSVQLFYGNKTNNTNQRNTTTLLSGTNDLFAICSDPFGETNYTNTTTVYVQTLYLIDEVDNVLFNVQNLTGARVYLDDNSSYFDFKTANTSNVSFISADETKLRFELIPETGTTITRWIDVSLVNETSLRICANKQGVVHYEQIIISGIERPVVLKSVFANCYVGADDTRFAYETSLALKSFTIQTLYYLYIWNSAGEQVILASVDGSIQTFINLDMLEFSATPYDFSIIESSLSFKKTGATTVTIQYENVADDNVNGNLTIIRLDTDETVLSLTNFTDFDLWTLVYDFSTLTNITNGTMFQIIYTAENTEGFTNVNKLYFTARGTSGILLNEIAGIIAVLFILFGLTLTSARVTFAWFGAFICLGNFLILTLAVGGVWYITFLQGVTAMVLIYIIINLVSQNWETVT